MPMIEVPEIVLKKAAELNEICTQYPDVVPIEVYCEFSGINKDTIRTMIERGSCPFGIGKPAGQYSRRITRIPMLKLYNWYTDGAIYRDQQMGINPCFGKLA